MLPIIHLNFDDDYFLQQDNVPIHKSKETMTFFNSNGISLLDWPPRSPDINIVDDMWKAISDFVYDGPQFSSKAALRHSIKQTIDIFNVEKRNVIIELYASFRRRLCTIMEKEGDIFNK